MTSEDGMNPISSSYHSDNEEEYVPDEDNFDEVNEYYENQIVEYGFSEEIKYSNDIAECPLDERLKQNILNSMKFKKFNCLQIRTIPIIISGMDLLVQAPTGIGKSAAFLIPVVQRVIDMKKEETNVTTTPHPYAIVLCNTKSLAQQLFANLLKMISGSQIIKEVVVDIYTAGHNTPKVSADILICTMGCLTTRINSKEVYLDNLKMLVIDEADSMTDSNNFGYEIEKVLENMTDSVKNNLQSTMFSATYVTDDNGAIMLNNCQRQILNNVPAIVRIPSKPGYIKQRAIDITTYNHRNMSEQKKILYSSVVKKFTCLIKLIDHDLERTKCGKNGPYKETIVVFCETKKMVNIIAVMLQSNGYNFFPLSSSIEKKTQSTYLSKLTEKEIHGVVATNIMARGIDVPSIKHIIIMDMDTDFSLYKHRVGRTGRSTHGGSATVLVDINEFINSPKAALLAELYEFMQQNGDEIPEFLEKYYQDYNRSLENAHF